MNKITIFVIFVIAAFSSLPDRSCANEYRLPTSIKPTTFDPAAISSMQDSLAANQLYDGLVSSENLMLAPALAETWEVMDSGKQYIFTLRKAFFHNGAPVTAADVSFTLHRLARTDPPSPVWRFLSEIQGAQEFREGEAESIQGISTPDVATVVIKLQTPSPLFLFALGMNQAGIVSKDVVAADPNFTQPVGAGPFKFHKLQDNELELWAHEMHYRGSPNIKRLFIIAYPGENISQALTDFNNGQLHELPLFGDVASKITVPFDTISIPRFLLGFYGFNTRDGVFTDPAIRRALVEAVDRPKLVSEAHGEKSIPAKGVLPEGMPGASPSFPVVVSGPGRLFDELRQVRLITIVDNPTFHREVDALNSLWKPLGVELVVEKEASWNDFQNRLRDGDFDIYRQGWSATIPDPAPFLEGLVKTNGQGNLMGYTNPAVDAMLDGAFKESNPLKRYAQYQELEKLLARDAPLLPLYNLRMSRAYQKNVTGQKLSPLGASNVDYSLFTVQ